MKAHFVLLFALPLAIGLAADGPFTLPPDTAKLKPGPGAELLTAQCLVCHSADYISTQPRFTRAQWQGTVVKMQQKYGAPVATNTVGRLVDYLAGNYGSGSDAAIKK
jgi:sulfite dehydrogenase (cytochrome) subunit B